MTVKDFYQILGLEMDSSTEDVKRAYRRLVKNYHPDAHPNNHDPNDHEKFKEITEAYKVLSDPEKRKKYDQMNEIRNGVTGVYQPIDLNGEEEIHYEEEAVWEEVVDTSSDNPSSREEDHTRNRGGRKSKGRRESPGGQEPAGESAGGKIFELEVSFELAVKGGRQILTIPGYKECEKCGGTGARSKKDAVICRGCEGSGIILSTRLSGEGEDVCPMCKGKGKLIKGRCSRCKGEGRSRKDMKVLVEVPAGVEDGSRIRLDELVSPDQKGAWNETWIEFKVRSHPFFQRNGLDILCEVPIGIDKAILGGTISVKTAKGRRVSVKIPPGTDSGTIFRIREEGISKDGRKGHQLVKIKIVTPKHLSNKAREHLDLFLREIQSKIR